jgi:hypothetical protein
LGCHLQRAVALAHSETPSRQFLATTALGLALVATGAATAYSKPKPGEFRVFRPEADTYVSAAQPDRNFGGSQVLRTDSSPKQTVYLKFRLKRLKGKITSVTLLLHAQAGSRASYQVRRVYRNEWLEREVTFENAPRLSLRYASSKPVQRGAWSAVDVSSFVIDDLPWVSLAVTTRNPVGVVFESRESSQGPRLVVRTRGQGPEGPAPAS